MLCICEYSIHKSKHCIRIFARKGVSLDVGNTLLAARCRIIRRFLHFTGMVIFTGLKFHCKIAVRKRQGTKAFSEEPSHRNMLRKLLSLFVLCCLGLLEHTPPVASTGAVPSATRTLVWGSGLEANIVLPARFFYIQTVDSSGRK